MANILNQPNCRDDSKHIMVVDDESHIGLFIEVLLSSHGFNVISFTDSQNALDWFMYNPGLLDLVITDQNMPAMCGLELATKLRDIRSDLPIILCSGYGYEDIAHAASEIGIVALSKPLMPNELIQQIGQFIQVDNVHCRPVANR